MNQIHLLRFLPVISLGLMGMDHHQQAPLQSYRPSGRYWSEGMTPKQLKARKLAKIAKQSRKRNR